MRWRRWALGGLLVGAVGGTGCSAADVADAPASSPVNTRTTAQALEGADPDLQALIDELKAANADLAQQLRDQGVDQATIDAADAAYNQAIDDVLRALAALGATPAELDSAKRGTAFFDTLDARARAAGTFPYAVIEVGQVKLVYKNTIHAMPIPGDVGPVATDVTEAYDLQARSMSEPYFPNTFSDQAAIDWFGNQNALIALTLLETGLRIGPWFLIPGIGQAYGVAAVLTAGGGLLLVDALTGESLASIGDDFSFTVLAVGKVAPGPLRLLVHTYLLARAGQMLIHFGWNGRLILRIVIASMTYRPILTAPDLVGTVEPEPVGPPDICDVTKPSNRDICAASNPVWAARCCPNGQVGTGLCTIFEQRCVVRASGDPLPYPTLVPEAEEEVPADAAP